MEDFEEKYGNLTGLIQYAVKRQIERDNGVGQGDSGVSTQSNQPNGRIDDILTAVNSIETELGDLTESVSKATDAVHAQQGVDPDLAPSVFEALPEGKENAATADDIAQTVGRKDASVRFALENLRKNTGTVKKTTPLEAFEGQSEDTEGGYERGIAKKPRWFKTEGA